MANIFQKSAQLASETEEERAERLKRTRKENIPVTPEALYGDLVEEEEQAKSDIADEFGFIEEELGRREAGEGQRRLEAVEAKKKARYESATGTTGDVRRLQQIEQEMAQFGETRDSGLTVAKTLDELYALKEERSRLQSEIQRKGVLELPSGERIKIPEPGMAADALSMTIARTLSEMGRGLLSLAGILPGVDAKEVENIIPKVKSENDVVNIASETIPLLIGGGAGAVLATKYLTKAPKLARLIGFQLGAPLGEATLATEETGTLFNNEEKDALRKKVQVLAEGLAINPGLEFLARGIAKVGDTTGITRLIEVIPALLLPGDQRMRNAVRDQLADIIAQAENATTAEERRAALEGISAAMRENFSRLTGGVDLLEYLKGEVDLPEEAFKPMTTDIAESDPLSALGTSLETREPSMLGARQRQKEAVQRDVAIPEERLAQAEEAGTQAREQLGERIETEIGEVAETQVKPFEEVSQEALEETRARVTPVEGETLGGLDAAQENFLASRAYAADATDIVQTSFLTEQGVKNSNYDAYTESVADDLIPAALVLRGTDTFTGFAGVMDELGIASPLRTLIPQNIVYRGTLKRLANQERAYNAEVIKRLNEELARQSKGGLPSTAVDYLSAARAAGPELGQETIERIARETLDDLKATGKYEDVNIADLEGMLRSMRESRRGAKDPAVQGALDELIESTDNIIKSTITPEQQALRDQAETFFQAFSDIYRQATGKDVFSKFKFGDKISPQMLAEARTNLSKILDKAGTDEASMTLIQNIRSNLQGDDLAKFDDAVENYFVSDILSRTRADMSDEAIAADPIAIAQALGTQLRKLSQDRKFSNLLEFSPNVRTKIEGLANDLLNSAGDATRAKEALDVAKKSFDDYKKVVDQTPEAKFSKAPRTTNSLDMIQRLMKDPDAEYTMANILEKLDDAGKQQLKESVGIAIQDAIQLATGKTEGTGKLSLTQVDKFMNSNNAFKLLFPEGDPQREFLETVVEQAKVVQSPKMRGMDPKVITGAPDDLATVVGMTINYIQGPLSKEGRRSKMISNLFFKLAGGPEKAQRILAETFSDPRLAYQMIEEAKEQVRMTGVSLEDAKKAVLGRYLLTRFGITSVDEWNKEVQSFETSFQTDEAFAR